jgi:hypothetical protein
MKKRVTALDRPETALRVAMLGSDDKMRERLVVVLSEDG